MTHPERLLTGYAVLGILAVVILFFILVTKALGSIWLLIAFASAPIAYFLGALLDDDDIHETYY